jgi:hypothetical protein
MKILGILLALAMLGIAYGLWGLSWPGVLAAGLVGVVLSQAMHSKGWREALTTAGSVCLAAALVGTLLLLFQLFMS